jgi:hypothetical protein
MQQTGQWPPQTPEQAEQILGKKPAKKVQSKT